jgi:hypothetical protein
MSEQEDVLNAIRFERDKKLKESDWTQVADSPLSNEEKQLWAEYRQKLRDMTKVYLENPIEENTYCQDIP